MRDVMDLLVAARPAELDPEPDAQRRETDIARAMAEFRLESPLLEPPRGATGRDTRFVGTDFFSGRRLVMGAGALAAAASLAAAIAIVAPGAPSPSRSAASGSAAPYTSSAASRTLSQANLTAQQILLAAAHQVETAPTSGKYWMVETEYTAVLDASSAKAQYAKTRYSVAYHRHLKEWIPRSMSGKSWQFRAFTGAEPVTAKDRAIWQELGSPKTFCTITRDEHDKISSCEGPRSFAGEPGVTLSWWGGTRSFWLGSRQYSLAQLQALPADPAALRQRLVRDNQRVRPAIQDPSAISGILFDLLTLPVTPALRATAYQLLAEQDDVTSLGTAQDARGRPGDLISIGPRTFQFRLIVDPATGALLQDQRFFGSTASWVPDGVANITNVYLSVGWTDSAPPKT